jgi:hypothetical protein
MAHARPTQASELMLHLLPTLHDVLTLGADHYRPHKSEYLVSDPAVNSASTDAVALQNFSDRLESLDDAVFHCLDCRASHSGRVMPSFSMQNTQSAVYRMQILGHQKANLIAGMHYEILQVKNPLTQFTDIHFGRVR